MSAGPHLPPAGAPHQQRLRGDPRLVQSFSTGGSEGKTSESERLQRGSEPPTFTDHLEDIRWRGGASFQLCEASTEGGRTSALRTICVGEEPEVAHLFSPP